MHPRVAITSCVLFAVLAMVCVCVWFFHIFVVCTPVCVLIPGLQGLPGVRQVVSAFVLIVASRMGPPHLMDDGASTSLPVSGEIDLADQTAATAVSSVPRPPTPCVDSLTHSVTRTSRSRHSWLPRVVRYVRALLVLLAAVLLRRLVPLPPLLLHQRHACSALTLRSNCQEGALGNGSEPVDSAFAKFARES